MASKTWFITGCSAGLGFAMARRVLAIGHNVVATSRNPSKDPELVKEITASERGRWLILDVTHSQDVIDSVIKQAEECFPGGIDVVVNNAGYCLLGAWEDLPEEAAREQFETNYWGPSKILRAVLPSMRARKSGTIVNISSIAGCDPLPSCSLYSATKWALEALSEALSIELKPFNIRVLIVEPGAFRTRFLKNESSKYVPVSSTYVDTPADKQIKAFRSFDGQQYGDSEKGVTRIFEIVMGEGMGEGLQDMLRLPLGMDCWSRARKNLESRLRNFDEAKEVAKSTNMDQTG